MSVLLCILTLLLSCEKSEDSVLHQNRQEEQKHASEIFVFIDTDIYPSKPDFSSVTIDPTTHLLPQGFDLTEDKTKADYIVTSHIEDWNNRKHRTDRPTSTLMYSTAIKKEYYAPTVLLWNPNPEVTMETIHSGTIVIRPITDINPPHRAVPVEGRYIDDPEYPLVKTVVLSIYSAEEIQAHQTDGRKELAQWANGLSVSPAPPQILWIGGVGDIMPSRGVDLILHTQKDGLTEVFGTTLPHLQGVDLLLGNLETAVTTNRIKTEKSYTFRIDPEVLPYFNQAGFDYFCLCNNHCYDFGETGFTDTLIALEENGIATSGAGMNIEEATETHSVNMKGKAVHILSVGAYPRERNGFDGQNVATATDSRPGILWAEESALEVMEHRFGESSFDIVCVHGGEEWRTTPSARQQELYKTFIQHGADLVLGSHPHVLQGVEAYRGKVIAYSLGNFIFPGMDETEFGEDSLILKAGVVDTTIIYLEYIPVVISGKRIAVDTSGKIIERFLRLSRAVHEN